MKCPHCGVEFHENWAIGLFRRGKNPVEAKAPFPSAFWEYRVAECPRCGDLTIDVGIGQMQLADVRLPGNEPNWERVRPIAPKRVVPSAHVPEAIASDYLEACLTLVISPKASAALSRRCLQHILRDHGYKAKNLAHEIDLVLAEQRPGKALAHRSRSAVDAIRHFGNFSAHPTENKASIEVIDVEEHEAESCLETIEELFDHFYDGPALVIERKAKLDAKLAAAGKPPSKG